MRSLLIHITGLAMLGFVGTAFAQSAEDEAKLCGIDPAHSTFRTTHFTGGDVTVAVPVDADGNPIAALDAGTIAAKVVASGKLEKSIFPQQERNSDRQTMPVSVRVTCFNDGRRVVVTVPLNKAEPYPPSITKLFGQPSAPPAQYGDESPSATMSVVSSTMSIDGYQQRYVYARSSESGSQRRRWVLVRDELICQKGDACRSS